MRTMSWIHWVEAVLWTVNFPVQFSIWMLSP